MAESAADALARVLEPLTRDPASAAVLCDIDGTLAPIVASPEEAAVCDDTAALLRSIAGRYGLVACVTGRLALEARRLVGVAEIVYAGIHGGEILRPGESAPEPVPELNGWQARVAGFASSQDTPGLRALDVRREDKGAIAAFHWRNARDEEATRAQLSRIAAAAETQGLRAHWGRKVLEVRPPIDFDKGRCVSALVRTSGERAALYGGDDATDLDAYDGLERSVESGELDAAVLVAVRSEEGPCELLRRANLIVDGVNGFNRVLQALIDV